MRLKEIKPGMVITCTHREEVIELWDYQNKNHGTPNDDEYGIDEMLKCYMEGYHFKINGDEWEEVADGGIPYATLLIPDMSAEEVLQIFGYICDKSSCSTDCPFRKLQEEYSCPEFLEKCYKKVVEICQQWKSEHEKKEPEVETVDICRIIEIQPNGYKRCVHEEDIETELLFGGDEREKIEEILKRYCMEHEGNFIAVHEVVSRVKAVE